MRHSPSLGLDAFTHTFHVVFGKGRTVDDEFSGRHAREGARVAFEHSATGLGSRKHAENDTCGWIRRCFVSGQFRGKQNGISDFAVPRVKINDKDTALDALINSRATLDDFLRRPFHQDVLVRIAHQQIVTFGRRPVPHDQRHFVRPRHTLGDETHGHSFSHDP